MPQTIEEDEENEYENMVSNLPLLFAAGYPTTLEKISEKQLEKFIPFMVQCSLGYIQVQDKIDYTEPEWWPDDIPFTIPFTKPKNFVGDWCKKMKEIVVTCYIFHKNVFLLRFCTELAAYETKSLRFISNYNSTTSLFHRVTNKLLVTFRNENMLYDQQPVSHRKCLMPRNSGSQSIDNSHQQMVEPALFDIYLCDNCDAELYSLEAYKEHEKACQSDDDVIFCEPDTTDTTVDDNHQKLSAFLLNFNLQSINNIQCTSIISTSQPNKDSVHVYGNTLNSTKNTSDKRSNLHRRARGRIAFTRCQNIPISSPAGQFLIKSTKATMTEEYLLERLDRLERFCNAPPLNDIATNRPKWMDKKSLTNFIVTYKKLQDHQVDYCHIYKYPKRQFSNECKRRNFLSLNSILIKLCKPFSIRLERMSKEDIDMYLRSTNVKRFNNFLYCLHSNNQYNNNNHKYSKAYDAGPNDVGMDDDKQQNFGNDNNIVDYIDLCSSDGSDSEHSIASSRDYCDNTPNTNQMKILGVSGKTIPMENSKHNNDENYVSIITSRSLKPSVYLFSNTFSPTALSVSSAGTSPEHHLTSPRGYQNQENILVTNCWLTKRNHINHNKDGVDIVKQQQNNIKINSNKVMPSLIRISTNNSARSLTANYSV